MPKVTALRGFDWYPDEPNKRVVVLEGQSIDVTDEQANLLAEHGHIDASGAAKTKPVPQPAPDVDQP